MARVLAVVVIAVIGSGCGGRSAARPTELANRAPPAAVDAGDPGSVADVDALIERWELCHHWAGEEPYDAARRAEIERGIADSCPGNDQARAQLARRYADRPAVLARLRALEE